MMYRLHLRGGGEHVGFDERDIDDLLEVVDPPHEMDDLPEGWTWLAQLHVKLGQVIAISMIREP